MADEISTYLDVLTALRGKVLKTLQEAKPEAWNWTPLKGETNSLYVLATHAVGAEHGWIYEIMAGGEQTRNRPAEFQATSHDLGELYARYAKVAQETESVLRTRSSQSLARTLFREGYGEISERWIVLHIIQHYSEHLGQMYLTKQLWEENASQA